MAPKIIFEWFRHAMIIPPYIQCRLVFDSSNHSKKTMAQLHIFQSIALCDFTLFGTIHLRRRQIFTIFDPYPPTIGIPAKCLWRGFLILMYCDLWTIGTWGHPSPPKTCWRLKWMVPTFTIAESQVCPVSYICTYILTAILQFCQQHQTRTSYYILCTFWNVCERLSCLIKHSVNGSKRELLK